MKINNVPTPVIPDARTARTDANLPSQPGRAGAAPLRNAPARPAPRPPSAPEPRLTTLQPNADANVIAPAGTDPKLWSILTSEERSYFAKSAAQGPVTYARVMMGAQDTTLSPAMRGLRLDIRG